MADLDGYAAAPTAQRAASPPHARAVWAVFTDHGALSTVEAWGDDLPLARLTASPRAVQAGAAETVVSSPGRRPSKEARDAGRAAVMADPRIEDKSAADLPFDGARMIGGGSVVAANLS